MTLILQKNLPAIALLNQEGVAVATAGEAIDHSLPLLNIALLNLMPNKVETEVQIMRLLDTPHFQVAVQLLKTATYISKNTAAEYLNTFYKTFKEIEEQIDGLIITGADVEMMEFEDVAYWDELQQIMDWAEREVKSTFFICWASQAGVYHHYRVQKHKLKKKLSGVFAHEVLLKNSPIAKNLELNNQTPHSRYTELRYCELTNIPELEIVSTSAEAGVYLAASRDKKKVFATGHAEYDTTTLKQEYFRDLKKGIHPAVPLHYFQDDDPTKAPKASWREHSKQLFSNWLRFYVHR